MYQKLFQQEYVIELRNRLWTKEDLAAYSSEKIEYDQTKVLVSSVLKDPKLRLVIPKDGPHFDFENAKIIFEAYKEIGLTRASDPRFWVYLAHVTCRDYMIHRWPLKRSNIDPEESIATTWFIKGQSAESYLRHGIARLWWGANMTYDKSRKNPYELTEELFSHLDYFRVIFPKYRSGRSMQFMHAVLEYAIENKAVISQEKEAKIRFLAREINFVSGYKSLMSMDKNEIKKILNSFNSILSDPNGSWRE